MGASFLDAFITLLIELGMPWTERTPFYLVGIFVLILFPFFLRNIRIGQARNLLKRSNTVFHEERRNMEQAAIQKVADIPTALLGLADQALSMQRRGLAEEIIQLVPSNRKYRYELQKLQLKIHPPPPPIEQELFVIEQLIENGLLEVAHNRFKKASQQWPNHPDIERLSHHFSIKNESEPAL